MDKKQLVKGIISRYVNSYEFVDEDLQEAMAEEILWELEKKSKDDNVKINASKVVISNEPISRNYFEMGN